MVSFFESSADDIETPILHRLSTPDTILRRSCDASMVVQAIIDAIIDLAIPVASAFQDVIGELELDVLTQPDIKTRKKSVYPYQRDYNDAKLRKPYSQPHQRTPRP